MGKIDLAVSPHRRWKTLGSLFWPLVFFALAMGIALFLQLRDQAFSFTIKNHFFRPEIGPLLLAAVIIFILLIVVWILISHIWTKNSRLDLKEVLALDFPTYMPIAWLLLAPLALNHYLTRDDLAQRLALFAMAVVAAVLYLKAVRVVQADRQKKSRWGNYLDGFLAWPLRRRLIVLTVAAILLTNGGVRLMTGQGKSFGGDEPHYLLIAHSLIKDGDLDLANNYKNGDFKAFMPPQVTNLPPHTAPARKPGVLYSFHSPGIAILLLPFYALGLALGKGMLVFLVRFGMSLVGAFLGIQLYLYARETWKRERLALAFWAVTTLSAPIFFYATHIYTELVIAALGLFVFRRLRSARSLDGRRLALIGVLLASFIWFHALKYVFIQGPFFIYALWSVWNGSEAKDRIRRLAAFFIPAGLCFAAYFSLQVAIYGSFNPTSVSFQGAMNGRQTASFIGSLLTGIPFRLRWETLAGYFLDQKDGLFLYAPIYAFAFIGVLAMLRAKARDAGWLLFIAGPYILISAFLTQRTGYAPQARPLVPVIWILAIFIGGFIAENGNRLYRYLFNGAAGISFLFTWLLCLNPFALYQETTFGITERAGALFVSLSNLHFYLPDRLPSFIKVEDNGWAPNGIWILALVLFCAVYFLGRGRGRGRGRDLSFAWHAVFVSVLLLAFFALVVFFPRPVLVAAQTVDMPSGEKWAFFPYSLVARMETPGSFELFQDNRDYDFFFATQKRLANLNVEFGSPYGDYDLRVCLADEPVFAASTRRQMLVRTIASPPAYRWKRWFLYLLMIRLDRKSDVRTAVTPYVLALRPGH
ncbi:MAG: hypothetical protein NTW95_07910 [Candidatus Aminicenantes bacterium]|nr:hypothetical protein [Candidatus Aminicenantes bacterium]